MLNQRWPEEEKCVEETTVSKMGSFRYAVLVHQALTHGIVLMNLDIVCRLTYSESFLSTITSFVHVICIALTVTHAQAALC